VSEWFFRKVLQALEKHTPGIVVRAELQILLNTTARGFGVPGKQIWQYSAGKALEEYARFTSDCLHSKRDVENAESALDCYYSEKLGSGSPAPVSDFMHSTQSDDKRLFRAAYLTGRRVRRLTGFTQSEDISRLTFWLYRNIRIAMTGTIPGKIMVRGCYFSRYYSPEDCRKMSCVDSGIISGLCGGGRLIFTKRITEGCTLCTAYFKRK